MKQEMIHRLKLAVRKISACGRSAMLPFAIFAVWTVAGAHPALAQQAAQKTFASAAEASQSLFQAVQHNNEQAIENILGGPTDLASCRDEAQDKLDREQFVRKSQEMHRLARETDGSTTLYIGAENWPFPVPLLEKNGRWHFDSDAGLKEILFRRIGENELTAIAICHEFIAAEKHEGAESNTANPEDSFAASLAAKAASEPAGGGPVLFQGYYFRVLAGPPTNGTRRFALIAYPAEYRSSGVMSFVLTANGIVYEKDLGVNSSTLASAMATFHKDGSWQAADQ